MPAGLTVLPVSSLRPRGGFRLSLRDVEQRPRVLGDNEYQPRASLASERRLHLGVGPQGRIATLDNAFDGREMFTLSEEAAAESIARIWMILREWKVYFEEYQVPSHQIESIAPAFRHIDDLSTQSLRKL